MKVATKDSKTVRWLGAFIAVMGIALFVVLLTLGRGEYGASTNTTAVVSSREAETGGDPPSTSYWVYLRFSSEAEYELFGRQGNPGIEVGGGLFDNLREGKQVNIVYRTFKGRFFKKMAIESVDGYEPIQGKGGLTTPGDERAGIIVMTIVFSLFILLGVWLFVAGWKSRPPTRRRN